MERIREPIRIATIFAPGRQIKPVWFDWHNRKHTVLETCYSWQERSGETTLLHFTVRTEAAMYELVYNTREQNWKLEWIEGEQ
jgi:hypothetical protein